ncbi:MAG: GvpL/GvpF family gas vesicle protein [Bradymonadaceae bacterium]
MLEAESLKQRERREQPPYFERSARLEAVTGAAEPRVREALRTEFEPDRREALATVAGRGLTALVAPASVEPRRVGVCTGLQRHVSLIPLSGVRAFDGPAGVRDALERHEDAILDALDRLGRARQIELLVKWDSEHVFDDLAEEYADLRTLRERTRRDPGSPSRTTLAKLGRQFEAVLDDVRRDYADTLADALGEIPRDERERRCRDERELVRATFLVETDDVDDFERRVYDAADEFDQRAMVEYTEPAAPVVFVDLELT